MNKTSLAFSALFGLTVAGAAAHAESVKHGALEICQVIDGGEVSVQNGVEACCAQVVTEYDSGHIDYGEKYCVACIEGTDNCTYYPDAWRRSPKENLGSLTKAQKQAPITGN
jgi:hypothetical protein